MKMCVSYHCRNNTLIPLHRGIHKRSSDWSVNNRSLESVLDGVAVAPFTSDKTNTEPDERANFN